MKTITVTAPKEVKTGTQRTWEAKYRVVKDDNAVYIYLEARGSAIEVIVAKITIPDQLYPINQYTNFYISSPSLSVAIPSIPTLEETWWIMDKLLELDVPAPDAVSVAKVLADFGDF